MFFLYIFVLQGDLLRKIVNVARGEIPGDVTSIALEGWRHIQVQSHLGLFEDLSVDRQENEREEGMQVVGSKRKRRAKKDTTPKN